VEIVRKCLTVALWLFAALALGGCDREGADRPEGALLKISCGSVGLEFTLCNDGAQRWAEATGNRVEVVSTPNSTTERLALYQQLLGAGADDIDVLQVDVVWPGILAPHLLDLGPAAAGAEEAHFRAIIENNTVDGRLVAMPWYTDAGVLYYRKDLLERYAESVPRTWAELTETASRIQAAERSAGNDRMWGFVWQGRAYEGLTCNALEWVASHGGGAVVDADGRVTIDNPRAAAALELAASWVGTISPPGVLNYAEEEARGVFQSGNAVFMRNWPYAWTLAQSKDSPIRGKVGVTTLPAGPGGKSAATLGGWQLAVSKYSRHPRLAAWLVTFLTSPEEQTRRAIAGAYNPTIAALYTRPDVLEANPFFDSLYETFTQAVARPSRIAGSRYNELSSEFWSAVSSVLAGQQSAAEALEQLPPRLERLLQRPPQEPGGTREGTSQVPDGT
jgi:trehalose/maltose transport system substrate-binding protein